MPSKAATARAEAAISATIAQADAIVSLRDPAGKAARTELAKLLKQADKRLMTKLAALTAKGAGETFTAAQASAFMAQIRAAIERVEADVAEVAQRTGEHAIKASHKGTIDLVSKVEQEYRGAALPPQIRAAMKLSPVLHGNNAVLTTRVATSLDRYGQHMGQEFAQRIQLGLLSGATVDQMTASLVEHGGPVGKVSLAAKETAPGVVQRLREGTFPEGLFRKNRYWAERIVRTETAYAHGGAALDTMQQMAGEGLQAKKKIVATFDNRTAPDSVYVHGQVRKLDEVFTDGAGRTYLHPPGRPNDREVVIPWFDHWSETPSTAAPGAAVAKVAQELANSSKGFGGFSPNDKADLAALEDAALHAEGKRFAADESRAAQVLKAIATEKIAVQTGLLSQAQAVKDLKASASAKADANALHAADYQFKKLAKYPKPGKPDTGPEAALVLWDLAIKKPHVLLKMHADAIGSGDPMLTLVQGKLKLGTWDEKQNVINKITATAGLDSPLTWLKVQPEFPAWVDAIAAKTNVGVYGKAAAAKANKQLAALAVSSNVPFGTSVTPAILTQIKAQYGHGPKPAVAPIAAPVPVVPKPAPVPAAPKVPALEIKPSGGNYHDVFDASGKKLAYFTGSEESGYTVSPPQTLAAFQAKKFASKAEAAVYAVEVGAAIKAQAVASPVAKATPKPVDQKKTAGPTSKFNPSETAPTTTLGKLSIKGKAKIEIESIKSKAAEFFAQNGVTLRSTHAPNAVDHVMSDAGVLRDADTWAGHWYSSSSGARADIGKLALTDKPKGPNAPKDIARRIEGDAGVRADKAVQFARTKYAASQAAIEHRVKSGKPPRGIDEDGYVTVYRGIKDAQADGLRKARALAGEVDVAVRSASSWSVKRTAALKFSLRSGVVVKARVHYSRFISQFEQERVSMDRYGDSESEWILAEPDEAITVRAEDIENPYDE